MSRYKGILRNLIIWALIIIVMVAIFNIFSSSQHKNSIFIPTSYFEKLIKNGEIKSVVIKGNSLTGYTKDGEIVKTFISPSDSDFYKELRQYNVTYTYKPIEKEGWIGNFIVSWLPTILFFLFFILLIRQFQAGGNKVMSFSKSRAKIFIDNKPKVSFNDVAGIDEIKEEVREIVDFLKNPKKYQKLGARIPKGILLAGPPGTGKTLLAKAIAGEAGVPFLSVSGSEFVEMFVGVGASRVRDLFEQAKKNAPCIIFIDEIDAVGRKRGIGIGGGHDEREQTLNQLLVEMDGFESKDGIIVIAATNRPDILDPALLRPGRFDRQIMVPLPDVKGRLEILKIHAKNKPLAEDVDLETIARSTPGFSGADLENLLNEAALIAAKKNKDKIDMEDLEEAKDKIIMGVARKSLALSEREKITTAYHEAGHALVGWMLPNADKVHKVTIIPRGRALGVTQQLPKEDMYTYTLDYLMDRLAVLFGGRVAEEIFLNTISTGAGNDIKVATDIARKMVCEWGMSEKVGPIHIKVEDIFDVPTNNQIISEDLKKLIDEEVKRILDEAQKKARKIILENKDKVERLAQALLEKETLTEEEIEKIFKVSQNEIKKVDKKDKLEKADDNILKKDKNKEDKNEKNR